MCRGGIFIFGSTVEEVRLIGRQAHLVSDTNRIEKWEIRNEITIHIISKQER